MNLLLTMFPFYLLGNLHCLGMCGPLAAMLGQHRYRYYYLIGRLFAFTIAGTIAGALGAVLNVILSHYHLSAAISFLFGGLFTAASVFTFLGRPLPGQRQFSKIFARANHSFSLLLLKDQPLTTFIFGFLTIMLPCGQSLLVFSACALSGSMGVGMLNGFAFALLTSPSLFFAMSTYAFLKGAKKHYNSMITFAMLFIGLTTLCRAFAEIGLLPHLALHITGDLHLALF